MGRGGGCLILLLIVAVMVLELWFALALPEWIAPENPEYLGSILGTVVLSVLGAQLVRWRLRRLSTALMEGRPGPAVAAIFGAMLIALPGYLTAVPGLLLQLPPIQKLFGRVAAAMFAVLMQRAAKRMGTPGGGMPGAGPMGGGMPFPPGGSPFAGMPPRADDRLRSGKVIDTTAERVDDGDDAH